MGRPRVIVVGAGFGGLAAARALSRVQADILVVDRSNHHLFQPLLYQVATAGLSPADIAVPVRAQFRRRPNVDVVMDEVSAVDPENKTVKIGGQGVAYDFLVLATGATHSYFGHEEWAYSAPGLKSLEDAAAIRRQILLGFERRDRAAFETGQPVRPPRFVIIGGGPTGVELAGAIAELARRTLSGDFRRLEPAQSQVLLLEGGPRLLATFPEKAGRHAAHDLRAMGVEVRLGTRVIDVEPGRVRVGEEWIESDCTIWAAGVMASGAGGWLGVTTDRAGRIPVGPDLAVPGFEGVYAIGDLCAMDPALPGIAPVAMQQGRYVAKVIRAQIEGRPQPAPFRYLDKGNLATIGRRRAAGEFRGIVFTGSIAWVIWLTVHIWYLIGFRNRLIVLFQWAWAYVTWERGARLITGAGKREPGEPISRRR